MNGNLAVGIITYNPGSSVLARLQATIEKEYKVYIFDNSPDVSIIRDYLNHNPTISSHITYLTCGKNVGLGIGLAALCSHAYYDSFPAMLFFDQDTVYSGETLDYISDFYSENIDLRNAYSAIAFNSKDIGISESAGCLVKDVRLVMNSGSLFYLDNLKTMNWHNTKYFVDCVDYEFCLTSSNFHFKVGEHSTTPGFDHSTEQGDQRFRVLGRELPMRAYPRSRILDSCSAFSKLIIKSIVTGNGAYFIELTKSNWKYLIIQVYVRIAKLFHRSGRTSTKT